MQPSRLNALLRLACVASIVLGGLCAAVSLIDVEVIPLVDVSPGVLVKSGAAVLAALCFLVGLVVYGVTELRIAARRQSDIEQGANREKIQTPWALPPYTDALPIPPIGTPWIPPRYDSPVYYSPPVIDRDNYRCVDCSAAFAGPMSLRDHMEDCHGWEQYPYPPAPIQVPVNQFTCVDCFLGFVTAPSLREHMQTMHGWQAQGRWSAPLEVITLEYACVELNCYRTFSDKHALRGHLEDAHGWEGPAANNWVCPQYNCGMRFATKWALDGHVLGLHPALAWTVSTAPVPPPLPATPAPWGAPMAPGGSWFCTQFGCTSTSFPSKFALDNHTRAAHPGVPVPSWANTPLMPYNNHHNSNSTSSVCTCGKIACPFNPKANNPAPGSGWGNPNMHVANEFLPSVPTTQHSSAGGGWAGWAAPAPYAAPPAITSWPAPAPAAGPFAYVPSRSPSPSPPPTLVPTPSNPNSKYIPTWRSITPEFNYRMATPNPYAQISCPVFPCAKRFAGVGELDEHLNTTHLGPSQGPVPAIPPIASVSAPTVGVGFAPMARAVDESDEYYDYEAEEAQEREAAWRECAAAEVQEAWKKFDATAAQKVNKAGIV